MGHTTEPFDSYVEQNAEVIAKDLEEFSRSAARLSSDRPRLLEEYPSHWVGVYKGEVVANSEDLDTLMTDLKRKGIPLHKTIVRFIEENVRTLIL